MSGLLGNRLLVTGSRDWQDEHLLEDSIIFWAEMLDAGVVMHGDCPLGADALVSKLARKLGLEQHKYPADWTKHGLKAGPLRNQQMVDSGGIVACLAFPTAASKGTWDCVRRARAADIPTYIIEEQT